MKNFQGFLLFFFFGFFLLSCKTEEVAKDKISTSSMRFGEITSRKDVEALNLDKEFGLSEKVYNEFLDSLTFENGVLVGAIYDGVERELLDTKYSDAFWAYFGISLRNPETARDKIKVYEGYKPKRGSCKANNRWVCVIRYGDNYGGEIELEN